MKIRITGHVLAASGPLTGEHDLPDDRAERLIRLGAAVPVSPLKNNAGQTVEAGTMEHARKVMQDQSETITRLSAEIDRLKDLTTKLGQELSDTTKEKFAMMEELTALKEGKPKPEAEQKPAPVEATPEPAPVEAEPEPAPVEAEPEPAPVKKAAPTKKASGK